MCFVLVAFCAPVGAAPDEGQVAYWDFDEGAGDVLHDRSGHGNHGRIHGATWVASGRGYALSFDGENDYVDCGNPPILDITGPITLQAWVHPVAVNRGEPGIAGKFFESYALTYYGNAYWYISSGGNNVNGPMKMNTWTHLAGTFDGTTLRMYVNGEEVQTNPSKFKDVKHGKNFLIGCIVGDPSSGDEALRNTAFFPGLIDGVRVHHRALSSAEVLYYFNLEAEQKGLKPLDTSKTNQLLLEPFFYPDTDTVVLFVAFRWALPLPEGTKMLAELARSGDPHALSGKELNPQAARFEDEAEFSLKGLAPGPYEVRAALIHRDGTRKAEPIPFRYPFDPPPAVPSPQVRVVPPLPSPASAPAYTLKVAEGGGFAIELKGQTYRVESAYSYPDAGDNRLVAGPPDDQGEPGWKVATARTDAGSYRVTAQGRSYDITRSIEPAPTRVLVKDTIHNRSPDVIGILLSNHVNTTGMKGVKVTIMGNPSVFVGTGDGGVGLVALDDLYQVQHRVTHAGGLAEVRTDHFGLDAGASYTIEWAVYPTATSDYYDFINQVRKDEGLNGHVEGAFAFVDRRTPPSKDLMALKNLTYTSIGCLGFPLDDPTVSLEGYEFVKYPKECAALTQTLTQTRQMHPGVRVMFHIAHSLYATDKPQTLFPDSRAIDANGRQFHYGPDSLEYYGNYFAKERYEEGWRWWLFYPTMENSFGRAMIEGTEFMLDRLGATGIWADGFFSGYVPGGYSYDRFDGHSVIIDPKTRRVTRKVTCVPYVSLPVLRRVVDLVSRKGGVVVTNGEPGPRSFWKLNIITSAETGGGDQRPIGGLHLGRTVTPLGCPDAIKSQRDVYRDILNKLEMGALYFWYGDNDVMKHKTLVEHMYPITFESIHAGIVRGKERIVTSKSGVYGWCSDRSLHVTHRYDGRGALTRNDFVTTVDEHGARTEVHLKTNESAVVVRLPLTLRADGPVNARVIRYDRDAVRLFLNGKGPVEVHIAHGEFPVGPSATCDAVVGGTPAALTPDPAGLHLAFTLAGETEVLVRRGS